MELLMNFAESLFRLVIFLSPVLAILGYKAYRSRVKTDKLESGNFFSEPDLVQFPESRIGYSDRIAYLMAELSDLVYYRFEDAELVEQAAARLKRLLQDGAIPELKEDRTIEKVLADSLRVGGKDELQRILDAAGIDLIETINCRNLEAIICKKQGDKPYLAVAFRGSEKNADWLVNAQGLPLDDPEDLNGDIIKGAKVHQGFFNELCTVEENSITAIHRIKAALEKEDPEQKIPVYFTGHSLGGAWALLATRLLYPKREGVCCYSFGAPRAANYEFYFGMKAAVYRVVNSADIVPRIPPHSSIIGILAGACGLLGWVADQLGLTRLKAWIEKGEISLNKLKDYRHYGDMRYLTDVVDGKWENVRLLANPQWTDQLEWIVKGVSRIRFKHMTDSHSMYIYREKLRHLAETRM